MPNTYIPKLIFGNYGGGLAKFYIILHISHLYVCDWFARVPGMLDLWAPIRFLWLIFRGGV